MTLPFQIAFPCASFRASQPVKAIVPAALRASGTAHLSCALAEKIVPSRADSRSGTIRSSRQPYGPQLSWAVEPVEKLKSL